MPINCPPYCQQDCSPGRSQCIAQDHGSGWAGTRPTTTAQSPGPDWIGPWIHRCCNLSTCGCGGGYRQDYHWVMVGSPIPPELPPLPPPAIEEPQDGPAQFYTITIPGIQDIIRIPSLTSPQLRREQIARWKSAITPVPRAIAWIPSVINFLDDIQDFMIVMLTLAIPALRRLPLRFIPGLGWILTINDVLNLTNGLLATALASRSFKRQTLKSAAWMWTRRNQRLRAVSSFLASVPKIPFLIQAGQVTAELTGYGIQLGALMGFITDSIWGTIKAAQGATVKIRTPPSQDIASKAARVLVQYPQHLWMYDILDPAEHYMVLAAGALAAQIVRDATPPSTMFSRMSDAGELSMPSFIPTNPCSLWALFKEGQISIDRTEQEITDACKSNDPLLYTYIDEQSTDGYGQFLPLEFPYPMMSDILGLIPDQVPIWENGIKNVFGATTSGTLAGMLHNEMALEQLNWANQDIPIPQRFRAPWDRKIYTLQSGQEPLEHLYEGFEIDAAHAIEYSVFPAQALTPEQLLNWLATARSLSVSQGLTHASFEDLKLAAIRTIGGFTRRRYETFPE